MLKVQPWAAGGLNRWLNPWFSDPSAKAGLSGQRRLLRAAVISCRNLLLLVVAVVAISLVGGMLPAYVLIGAGMTATSGVYWQMRARDRRGEAVSPALSLGLFAAVFLTMAYVRSLADQVGFHARYAYVIDLDRALFFGTVPTVWLQEQLHAAGRVTPLDVYTSVIYFSYFTLPVLAAVALWHLRPAALRLYLVATVATILVGSAWFTLLPTAPPWLAGLDGYLPPLTRIAPAVMNTVRPGFYEQGYETVGINEVAAFPSYHMAQTVLVALAAWTFSRRLRILAVVYVLSMGFSLVYLAEHYVSDVLAGVVLALAAWAAALRLSPAIGRFEGQDDLSLAAAEPEAIGRAA